MPNPPILVIDAVEKHYATVHAVRGVSFEVRSGEIFALLGPNGAGKSSLVRMIMGITLPDQGSIEFRSESGQAFVPQPPDLGYLPEDRGLYKDIPVLRTLVYFGQLRGMTRRDATEEAKKWLGRLDLAGREWDKLDTLSKGNQQKIQFISAILHRPKLAILDEPFSGLDPLNQNLFLEIIRELCNDGMTILLSAHQMALIEQLADRIVLMNRGQIVLQGTLGEIRQQAGFSRSMTLDLRTPMSATPLQGLPAGAVLEPISPTQMRLLLPDDLAISPILSRCTQELDLVEIHSERLSLHEIYIRTLTARGTETEA
ncbi:ABC transporter ATP-binding protein [Tuwongella immobilis]|uniref:ABC transporter domain-containing protein n=1 Tax=Tuwongella immobilis TaxID=692036 RepID=A0A6C2YMT9_9BACT|nr:ATP-binding cassette domain-containing protein [Tuwongella immobilis]VIP02920.1 sodium abc transporter atpase : ABC transporter related protein OS=Isosphaera pallida (strain ATCC 43644 / DSM 9630 / IS1B) GN=Isop_2733 PE=3 SV=1: ABC_tran [Tuwongella immobilis]VTS02848.1 sodium abc transporter atpase : ABC transporter related protein OS=Isosphaera pallida (strain ATCC 43644 / DSM 9630 / IS1B) GN=Isop_2733 PE=3 SV=1: ABC_tran [Tuwongella immobilis]